MGIAEGDIDGSGYPQYALTSMGDTRLQKLDPDEAGRGEFPVYRDIAVEAGATAHIPYTGGDKRPSTGWHSEFADFNNAGLLDLFISKGNLAQMPDFADYDPSNLLIGQLNGKFAEAGDLAGISGKRTGRGALIADFNLDGMLDILQIDRGSNVALFRNLGARNEGGDPLPMGNWTEIRLVEPNPNRDVMSCCFDFVAYCLHPHRKHQFAKPPARAQSTGRAIARHVLHGDEGLVTRLAHFVDGADVRMVDGRSQPRLAQHCRAHLLDRQQPGAQNLQHHRPLQLRVVGQVHNAAATRRRSPDDLVVFDRSAFHGHHSSVTSYQ